jgi:hypothetical protein
MCISVSAAEHIGRLDLIRRGLIEPFREVRQ